MAMGPGTTFTNGSGHSTAPHTNGVHLNGSSQEPQVHDGDELEPIAVVGLSLRFPQDAVSEDALWKMLVEKRCASTEFPKDRVNIDAFYNADSSVTSKISARGAHFLDEDIRAFDAGFFSIPPLEAASMDPQQRGLLETTYRALENAGIPMENVKGSDTSVHVGSFTSDFETLSSRDAQQIPRYSATGTSKAILSNRISWFFDLLGPSMTIDTACSSSMVALDASCNGLWAGDSNIGLVAGANLIFNPELNIALSNMSFLSPDSRCFSFDHRANGYSRGEGFGVLVLKRLSQAIKDGDTIRALIRSTGVNQDGHTAGGVTQPNKVSQARLITETYQKANLDMTATRFFEAHGTGTAIGDPIEARAIGESFRRGGNNSPSMYIGAVKSNLGHLEGASGIAGIIKTIQVLEKGIIPPNANFERLNSQIDAEFFNLEFPAESRPWPSTGLRRASVNSFGFGGTNAHAVLDDAYHYLHSRNLRGNHCTVATPPGLTNGHTNGVRKLQSPLPLAPRLLVWSAADEEGLARIAASYSAHFSTHEMDADILDDLAYTLSSRRSALPWKSFVVADSLSVLKNLEGAMSKPVESLSFKPSLGFIFTGQGAQWHAMGRDLILFPVFLESLTRSEDCLTRLGCKWSLAGELSKNLKETRVNEPEFSQPLCTAIQIALVDLARTLGIVPATVVGHSSGEIAAAYCIGSLSRMSALKLSYYRGVLASKLAATTKLKNRMAAIGLSHDKILDQFKKVAGKDLLFEPRSLSVSCINSPKSVTVSGPDSQLDILVSHLEAEKVFARKLMVNVGYHSPQMQEIAVEYAHLIEFLEPDAKMTETIMMSSVLSKIVSTDILCTPEYWVRNLVSPVNFNGAMQKCCSRSRSSKIAKKLDRSHLRDIVIDSWLEIGPHAALQGPFRDILSSLSRLNQVSYTSALIRNRSATESFLAAAGGLHCQGFKIDIARLNQLHWDASQSPMVLKDLPEYPFNHSVMHWEESRINKEHRFRKHGNHTLLGTPVMDWNPLEPRWRLVVRLDEMPWLEDHKVNGSILYPAAGMLAMAIEGMKQLAEDQSFIGFEVREATFHTAVVVPTGKEGIEIQACLTPGLDAGNKTWYDFGLFVCKFDGEWEEVCRGGVRPDYGRSASDVDEGNESKQLLHRVMGLHESAAESCLEVVEPAQMYKIFRDMRLDYGPSFQTLSGIHFNREGESTADIAMADWSNGRPFSPGKSHVIHPATLDAVFQLTFVGLSQGGSITMPTTVPSRIDKFWISKSGLGTPFTGSRRAYTDSHQFSQRSARCSMSVLDETNSEPLLRIDGLEVVAISSSQGDGATQDRPKYLGYHMGWKPDLDSMISDQILEYCQKSSMAEEPADWYQNLDFLSLAFGSAALVELQQMNKAPVPSMEKYASWIRTQLDRDVALTPVHARLHRKEQLWDPNFLRQLSEKMATSKRGKFYVKVGQELPKILAGEIETSSLFEPQALNEVYEEVYQNSQSFSQLTTYLDALIHKNPGMKMLEIGADTGATTKILHNTLAVQPESPHYSKYDFTDTNSKALDSAKKTFEFHKRMTFRILDIEKDPLTQGFEEDRYDIVVATNVLHATHKLQDTIRNVRKMLTSGGKLIFAETTVPEAPRNGFIFGLLPDWWVGSEDYRSRSPCVSEEKWDELLKENGFSGTDLVFQDFKTAECHGWSIMVATAVDTEPNSRIPLPNPIVISDRTSDQETLIRELDQALRQECCSVADVLTLDEAAQLTEHQNNHYILLSDLKRPLLPTLLPSQFTALQLLLSSAGSLLWVTRGGGEFIKKPEYGSVQGLCRVSRREHFNVKLVTLALEDVEQTSSVSQAKNITKTFSLMTSRKEGVDLEPEYLEIEGLLHINRVEPAEALNQHIFDRTSAPLRTSEFGAGPPIKMNVKIPGLIDSLEFIKDDVPEMPLQKGEIEVEVCAVGVNFKDLLTVLGRVDTDKLGCECSGVISKVGEACGDLQVGDRVAVCGFDFYRSYSRCDYRCAAKIPDVMSFAEAAAIPTAFGTAWWSLVEVARMQPGESILIHAASGGTGQAAVQIALYLGAEVYATVGSKGKKQLLMDVYGIPEDHIFYSRDLSFADGIRRMTNGQGVDCVLNSISGEGLVASWECVAPFGRFLEIGRRDIDSHGSLPMYPFINNATFTGVDLAAMVTQRPGIIQRMMKQVMALVDQGKLRPAYPLNVYSISNVEQALRTLQSGKSSGKIVLEIQKTALVPTSLKSEPSYAFNSNATYVVAGGLGGIGRSIARWLADRGAMNLILLSRSGPSKNEAAQKLLTELLHRGVRVEAPICDITHMPSVTNVMEQAKTMPPIKGCFQASMVLRDTTFGAMSFQEWEESTKPKIQGSWNLHAALPKGMDFFILLSSVCGIFGNVGQSNYAAGNTYQDALARYRVSHGEKATSLDLGVMLDDGFVAENPQMLEHLLRLGIMLPISQDEMYALFDFYCDPSRTFSAPSEGQLVTGVDLPSNIRAKGSEVPYALQQPLFRNMHQIDSSDQVSANTSEAAADYKILFAAARSLADAGLLVSEALKKKLSRVLGIPTDKIELSHRVESYGVDSLVAVELRNWLAKEMSADVAVFEILGGATLIGVGVTVAAKSTFRQSEWGE